MAKIKWKLVILIIIVLPLLITGFTAGYFLNRIWQVSKVITVPSTEEGAAVSKPNEFEEPVASGSDYENAALLDEKTRNTAKEEYKKKMGLLDLAKEKTLPSLGTKERINILVLGKAIPNYPGSDLTDTIILASINPTTYESSLLSIPRDLLVKIPDTNQFTKINAVYVYGLKKGGQQKGIDLLKRVITDVTGQKVDYYVMVNFTAFQQAIDALGGVDVDVADDIYDNRYPGPNYSYETFQINKGQHHLDGATALKFVRVRHTSGGDFGRAARQQQVIEVAKEKFFAKRGLSESLGFFNEMLKIVQDNVTTDIGFADYFPFMFLLKDLNVHQVVNKVLDNSPDGLLENYNPVMGGVVAYALRPRAGNYYEIHKLANYIFHLDDMQRQDKARAEEGASVTVFSAPQNVAYRDKVETLLRQKGYQVTRSDFVVDTINLWQREKSARLPVISEKNRDNLTSDTLIDKKIVGLGDLERTVVYDNAEGGKPFSLDDLSRRLDSDTSLYKEPSVPADFVIFLGNNVKQVFQNDDSKELFLTDEGMEQEKAESGQ